MGRPVGLQSGRLSGKYLSLCLSVCVSGGQECRFLGLCVVPRGDQVSGSEGTRALGLTGTVGTRGVVTLRGNGFNFSTGGGESGVLLASCVNCLTGESVIRGTGQTLVGALVRRLRECSGDKVSLGTISGSCVLKFVRCLGSTARGRDGGRGLVGIGDRVYCLGRLGCYLGCTIIRSILSAGPVGGVGGRSGPGQGEARQRCLAVSRVQLLSRARFCGRVLGETFLFDYFYKLERSSVTTLA